MKTLLSILGRPWLMEPRSADYWGKIAENVIYNGKAFSKRERLTNLPSGDKRAYYTESLDFGSAFRVDGSGNLKTNGQIQVFRVDGPIMKGDYCGTPGTQTLVQLLQAANDDKTVDAVLFWIDSPGGQVDGTERLAKAIKNSNKITVAYGDGQVCSAAYWIASSCDYLIVDDSNNGWNTEIGSVGTMCKWEDNSKELEAKGIVTHIVFADASTNKWGDFFKANAGDYTELKKALNGINDSFLSAVKENRGSKLKLDNESLLNGTVFNANDAVGVGLADAKGSFKDAVHAAVKLFNYPSKKQQSRMENTNSTPFDNVLVAIGADTLMVVDEGFVMSEEQLKNLSALISAKDTQIASVNDSLDAVMADLTTANDKHKEMSEALEESTTKVNALEASLTTANSEKEALQTKIDAMENEPGTFFRKVNTEKDKFKTEEIDLDAADHNVLADQALGKY